MFVSIGAAVFNLRVAVRAHGRETQVRLMPDSKPTGHRGDTAHPASRCSTGGGRGAS
jgi:hypothetical protein